MYLWSDPATFPCTPSRALLPTPGFCAEVLPPWEPAVEPDPAAKHSRSSGQKKEEKEKLTASNRSVHRFKRSQKFCKHQVGTHSTEGEQASAAP